MDYFGFSVNIKAVVANPHHGARTLSQNIADVGDLQEVPTSQYLLRGMNCTSGGAETVLKAA